MNELDLDELLNEVSAPAPKAEEPAEKEAIEAKEDARTSFEGMKDSLKVGAIKKIEKAAEKAEDSDKYLEEYIEEIEGTIRKYLSDRYRIHSEIKALKEELKEIKEEVKEEGVKVNVVERAFKEMVSELKEEPQDAILIESVKNMIKKDASLYGMVREEAS